MLRNITKIYNKISSWENIDGIDVDIITKSIQKVFNLKYMNAFSL